MNRRHLHLWFGSIDVFSLLVIKWRCMYKRVHLENTKIFSSKWKSGEASRALMHLNAAQCPEQNNVIAAPDSSTQGCRKVRSMGSNSLRPVMHAVSLTFLGLVLWGGRLSSRCTSHPITALPARITTSHITLRLQGFRDRATPPRRACASFWRLTRTVFRSTSLQTESC